MRVALVYNPSSGEEDHDRAALVERLEAAGHVVRHASVKEDGWERLIAESAEIVVAAGGDGTVRKVFKEVPTGGASVSVVPLGSANNIARTLGLAGYGVDRLVGGLDGGTRVRYDIGHVKAPSVETVFVEAFGGGAFAEALERAEPIDADGEEQLEVGLRLLVAAFAESEAREWYVEVDGHDASGAFVAVEVMNIKEAGPNIPLAPGADPGDGRLDVVLVGPELRSAMLAYLERRLSDEEAQAPVLPTLPGRRVLLRPPADSPLRVDDQTLDRRSHGADAEIVITAAARVLTLIAPAA
jgi:diacylglycerol kinase family enzyme